MSVLTPRELYIKYSSQPCNDGYDGDNSTIFANGTPYELSLTMKFVKHLKYPCIKYAKNFQNIIGTGKKKLGLPFKFLMLYDVEAFSEIQPDLKSGTSHAIRNACDLTRSCDAEISGDYRSWGGRSATEVMQHFGDNSLPRCLLALGPDMVSEAEAISRAISCDVLDCFYGNRLDGVAGTRRGCVPTGLGGKKCVSCGECPPDAECREPNCSDEPCCASDCRVFMNGCCKAVSGERIPFQSQAGCSGDKCKKYMLHFGIFQRKSYGGYGNFRDNTGDIFNSILDKIFIDYFQNNNGYDYLLDNYKHNNGIIQRMRTISYVNNLDHIKDLLYNGYGIVLMTNVGFPNIRDSTGLAYPDRLFYHTYSIIGYDDTLSEFPECVYLLGNSWGDWNTGGHPSWGPIPQGSFLVTESHLACMLRLDYSMDYDPCRKKFCPPPCDGSRPIFDPARYEGCVEEDSCRPFTCSPKHTGFGIAFALSTTEGFPKRNLDYKQFYPISKYRTLNTDSTLYYRPSP